MPYPFLRLNSSLFLSNHLAMLVISTSIKVVAWGAVRLVRTMCSAMARRMRLGVTSSSSSPATAGAAAGGSDTVGAAGGGAGAIVAAAGDGCGCVDREATYARISS